MRSDGLLSDEKAVLLVVDIQDAFTAHIPVMESLIERSRLMIRAAQWLRLPILVTEQYPKGLGRTIAAVQEVLGPLPYYDKVTFSCLQDEAIQSALLQTGRQQVILIGIETHVCIWQTAYGVLALGLQPYIVADAVGSRRKIDHKTALRRMRQAGAIITTAEAALFEMMHSSKHPAFRDISKALTQKNSPNL